MVTKSLYFKKAVDGVVVTRSRDLSFERVNQVEPRYVTKAFQSSSSILEYSRDRR